MDLRFSLLELGRNKFGGYWVALCVVNDKPLLEIGLAADFEHPAEKPPQPYVNFLFGLSEKISLWRFHRRVARANARTEVTSCR